MTRQPPTQVIQAATEEALKSKCQHSQRGAVLYQVAGNEFDTIIGRGYNHLPDRVCDGSDRCAATCGFMAVHAEQHAILAAEDPAGARLLHVKLTETGVAEGGPPSCYECAKMMLSCHVDGIWLHRPTGWNYYSADEYLRITKIIRPKGVRRLLKACDGGNCPDSYENTDDWCEVCAEKFLLASINKRPEPRIVTVYKAASISGDERPDLKIFVAGELNRTDNHAADVNTFEIDASELSHALVDSLPSGTLDRLIINLLRKQVSHRINALVPRPTSHWMPAQEVYHITGQIPNGTLIQNREFQPWLEGVVVHDPEHPIKFTVRWNHGSTQRYHLGNIPQDLYGKVVRL